MESLWLIVPASSTDATKSTSGSDIAKATTADLNGTVIRLLEKSFIRPQKSPLPAGQESMVNAPSGPDR
jgi:hypothetical protein